MTGRTGHRSSSSRNLQVVETKRSSKLLDRFAIGAACLYLRPGATLLNAALGARARVLRRRPGCFGLLGRVGALLRRLGTGFDFSFPSRDFFTTCGGGGGGALLAGFDSVAWLCGCFRCGGVFAFSSLVGLLFGISCAPTRCIILVGATPHISGVYAFHDKRSGRSGQTTDWWKPARIADGFPNHPQT